MTTWHVDPTWAERFVRGELPVDEVIDVSAHIGGCGPCMRTLNAAGQRSRRPSPIVVGDKPSPLLGKPMELPEFHGGLRWDAIVQSEELVSPVGLAWGEDDPSAQSRWEEGLAVAREFCSLDADAQVQVLESPGVYHHRGFSELLLKAASEGGYMTRSKALIRHQGRFA